MTIFAGVLPWIQIVLSVVLVGLILLQQSGAGVGSAFGGSENSSFYLKRGIEKKIFFVTVATAILFIVASITALFI